MNPLTVDEFGRFNASEMSVLGRLGPVIPPMPLHERSPHWPAVLKAKLVANPTCRGCRRKAETAHHIVPVGVDPTRELNPMNLVSVCVPCHFVLCHGGDWHQYVPNCSDLLAARFHSTTEPIRGVS